MEEDDAAEVVPVAVAPGLILDLLDLGVDGLGGGVGMAMG